MFIQINQLLLANFTLRKMQGPEGKSPLKKKPNVFQTVSPDLLLGCETTTRIEKRK